MDDKSIIFTKLGTVKSDTFEYTCEDFFQLMDNEIRRNIECSGVKYDEESDSYEIIFNSKTYQVYCGRDKIGKKSSKKAIIIELDKLVELTKKQKKQLQIEEQEKKEEQEQIDNAIENGNKGIFNSEKDKSSYILYAKRQLVEKKKAFHRYIRRMILYNLPFTALGVYATISLPFVLKLLGIFTLGIPYAVISDGVDEIVKEYKEIKTLKKRIKSLEHVVIDNHLIKLKDKDKYMVEVSDDSKEMSKVEKTANPIHGSIEAILEEFRVLKDKILEINDQSKKESFSKELLEIVKYYGEISKTFEEKGNMLSVHKNILNQIISITFRVDETLKEEKQKKEIDEEFLRMIDEIDSASTRSMGGK